MAFNDEEIIREFLIESTENLNRLDQELVELEQRPRDTALLASIFRTIHTVKGTSGLLGFTTLERVTHHAETLLSQLRDGDRPLTPAVITIILETVDVVRTVLARIEASESEGTESFESLIGRLEKLAGAREDPAPPAPDPPEAAPQGPFPEQAASPEPPAPVDLPSTEIEKPAVADSTIRVGVGLLDRLMDLVGELVLARNQIVQFNSQREDTVLNGASQRLNLITTELQENVMKTRMQPIRVVWNTLPRVVRDISVAMRKQIQLDMEGADTELDKTIIEAIKDPLVHLVRNCCDHGIEAPEARVQRGKSALGRILLRAYHEGGQVIIEISDNGGGIDVARVKEKAIANGLLRPEQAARVPDREAMQLIFQPGLSTARVVTNVSGRGVGMDVVKSNIEKIGGVVDVSSRLGEGTTFTLKIPLTLAIIPGLLITAGGERFVIPQVSLLELIRLEADTAEKQIEWIHGTPVYRRRGTLLPLAYLNQVLGLAPTPVGDSINIVVLQAEERQFGLVVEGIRDTQEIVVKPLGKQLKGLSVYAGATIMGDGKVALILDVLGIGQKSGVLSAAGERASTEQEQESTQTTEKQRLLLFRAGGFERLAVPLALVARLEEFPRTLLERADGRPVVQYRGQILPLVPLTEILGGCPPDFDSLDPVPVIVFGDGRQIAGVVVDQIVDIVEEAVTVRRSAQHSGLLGSAVIGGRVTDFVDLNAIFEAQGRSGIAEGKPVTVLVAESSPFKRGLIRSNLESAQHVVLEAASASQALAELERRPVDIVATALDLPSPGSAELLRKMRQHPDFSSIPALGLADSPEELRSASGFEACHLKFEREAMLESVRQLASAVNHAEPALAGAKENA